MKNAIVFVDANNWYHNLKKTFRPSDVDIVKVAEFLCLNKNYNLKQIRWYVSVPNIKDGKEIYFKHLEFLYNLEKRGVKVITRKLQSLSNKQILKKRINIISSLNLCSKCKSLVESKFLDLAGIRRKEKGIDVWIATDIIRKSIIEKECDACILISGDADFIPALELVKNNGNEILSVSVPCGYSNELRTKFNYFLLKEEVLMKCLK